jgi:hypothetical protein
MRIRSDKIKRFCGSHHRAGLAKSAGDNVKHLYDRFETVDQFSISVTVCLELLGFVSEEVEDAFGRVKRLERLGKGMCVCLA